MSAESAALIACSAASIAANSDNNEESDILEGGRRESYCIGTSSIKGKIECLKAEREAILKELRGNEQSLSDIQSGCYLPKMEKRKQSLKKAATKCLSVGTGVVVAAGVTPFWLNFDALVQENPVVGVAAITGAIIASTIGMSCIIKGVHKVSDASKTRKRIEEYKDYLEDKGIDLDTVYMDDEKVQSKMFALKQKDTLLRERLALTTKHSERVIIKKEMLSNYEEYMKLYRRLYPEESYQPKLK